jgi:hypothetical protein
MPRYLLISAFGRFGVCTAEAIADRAAAGLGARSERVQVSQAAVESLVD